MPVIKQNDIVDVVYDTICGYKPEEAFEILEKFRAGAYIPVEWIERKIKENLYDRYASWEDIAAQVDTNTMMKSWAILIERWLKENE